MLTYLEMNATDDIIAHMTREGSFKNMTAQHEKKDARERGNEHRGYSLRKGIAGDFKNYMTEDLVKTIDDAVSNVRTRAFEKYNIQNQ